MMMMMKAEVTLEYLPESLRSKNPRWVLSLLPEMAIEAWSESGVVR